MTTLPNGMVSLGDPQQEKEETMKSTSERKNVAPNPAGAMLKFHSEKKNALTVITEVLTKQHEVPTSGAQSNRSVPHKRSHDGDHCIGE